MFMDYKNMQKTLPVRGKKISAQRTKRKQG